MPDIERAAEVIRSNWREGMTVDYVKGDLWPDTVEQGYAVQATLASLRREPVVGWKIAATAVAGRTHINVDRPLAGRLFKSICYESGGNLAYRRNRMGLAEAEFAFTLGRDLPPRDTPYTEDEIIDAIEHLHPALEFPDSRFKDYTVPGTAGLIADNACASDFVLGEATTEPFNLRELASHSTSLFVNDEEVTSGSGADVLQGPLSAMVWIVHTLNELGIGLEAGQFVTTGVTGKPSPVKVGDVVRADLGVFGSAVATLV